jgi:hypothetical protein
MIAAGAALVTVQACGSSTHYGTAIVPDAGADTGTNDVSAAPPEPKKT